MKGEKIEQWLYERHGFVTFFLVIGIISCITEIIDTLLFFVSDITLFGEATEEFLNLFLWMKLQ